MVGSTPIGSATIGSFNTTGTTPAVVAPSLASKDTPLDLILASPIVTFWKLTATTGSVIRVVDFGDPEASSTIGQVTYDSEEYTTYHVGLPSVDESLMGRSPSASIDIHDPEHGFLNFVTANDNLINARVDMSIIEYDKISDPSLALTRTFTVLEVMCSEGPSTVSVVFGTPSLFNFKYPRLEFNRIGCHNDYQRRFDHSNENNYCNFPSDEFQAPTRQNYKGTVGFVVDAESKLDYGWYAKNRLKFFTTTNETWTDGSNVIGINCNTDDSTFGVEGQTAPHLYKKITDDMAVDVTTKIFYGNTADKNASFDNQPSSLFGNFIGLFAQNSNVLTDWIMFGQNGNNNSGGIGDYLKNFARHQDSTGVTDALNVDSTDNCFRLKLNNPATKEWKVYSKSETEGSRQHESTAWTLRGTYTLTNHANYESLNVGFVFVTLDYNTPIDANGNMGLNAIYIPYIRFLNGGLSTCDRTLVDCERHENTRQRNGYLGLPEGLVRF